jgi:hypothetical protein
LFCTGTGGDDEPVLIAGWVPPSIGLKALDEEERPTAQEHLAGGRAPSENAGVPSSAESAEKADEGSESLNDQKSEDAAPGTICSAASEHWKLTQLSSLHHKLNAGLLLLRQADVLVQVWA